VDRAPLGPAARHFTLSDGDHHIRFRNNPASVYVGIADLLLIGH